MKTPAATGWISPAARRVKPAIPVPAFSQGNGLRLWFAPLLLLSALLALEAAALGATPPKFAGTYRIESWRGMEAKGLFHFFYLHAGGGFLLGAEWPGNETSRAAGTWRTSGDLLSLNGTVHVSTNQGKWRVPFRRTYRITVSSEGIRLTPIPEKNRYGLLGWPNPYTFHRTSPAPNLPSGGIPAAEEEIRELIERMGRGQGGAG